MAILRIHDNPDSVKDDGLISDEILDALVMHGLICGDPKDHLGLSVKGEAVASHLNEIKDLMGSR